MKSFQTLRALVFGTAAAWMSAQVSAEVLFSDNLDSTNSAARWKVFAGYYQGGDTNDFSLQWGVDYSQLQYEYYASASATPDIRSIPAPPHSDGSTLGLLVNVNKQVNADPNAREAFGLSLYPAGQSFSGDYVLKFDLFLNYDGYAGTDGDTTQYATYGLNFAGDKVNWTSSEIDSTFIAGPGAQQSDGLWFMNSNDGFAQRNFRGLLGSPIGGATLARTVPASSDPNGDSIFLDRDGDGIPDNVFATGGPFSGDFAPYIQRVFPQPASELRGTPGKSWIPVEVSQYKGVITWKMNGWTMASYTNSTPYTSGDVMIGYADLFNSVADPGGNTWALFDNVRVERIRTVVVDTADNNSTATDGKTSFLEALQQLDDNDVITFNIPGAGPHYIVTPAGGYPLITKNNVTIDGYSQPGATVNTAGIHSPNNAGIQIVFDSRDGGTTSLADYDGHGYGSSESAILPLLGAQNFTLRGVSVLSISGLDTPESPFIYGVAMVKDVSNVRIQGCWFGVDPGNPTAAGVHGGRSALAGFKWDDTIFASNVIVGTDSDGMNDAAEQNVICGQLLAIHLETPNVRVAGNFINYLPDGSLFHYDTAGVDLGHDGTYEFFENGAGDNNIVGTDGDVINDANEANLVGPVKYDQFLEFWRPATNVTVAGNYVGFDLDGSVSYVNPSPAAFITFRQLSTLRIGSAFRGDPTVPDQAAIVSSDLLSFNHIANLGRPILAPNGANNSPDNHSWVVFTGNELINNLGSSPLDPSVGVDPVNFYAGLLAAPDVANAPVVSTNSTMTHLQGTLPTLDPTAVLGSKRIFIWLADTNGLSHVSTNYPNGWVQGAVYLGEFDDNGSADQNMAADAFDIDLTPYGITLDDLARVFVVAEYHLADGRAATVQFSNTVGVYQAPGKAIRFGVPVLSDDGLSINLSWSGGMAPYTIQSVPVLGGTWKDLTTLSGTSLVVPATNSSTMFRIVTN